MDNSHQLKCDKNYRDDESGSESQHHPNDQHYVALGRVDLLDVGAADTDEKLKGRIECQVRNRCSK